MINNIKSFLASRRQKCFERRLEAEIYGAIFPHLKNEKDYGYPFDSGDSFRQLFHRGGSEVRHTIKIIEQHAEAMPKAYGEAFRYIFYRDMKERLEMYRRISKRRVQPKTCDPRFVATCA